MRTIKTFCVVGLVLVLTVITPWSAFAQRKKKDGGDVYATGIKLREAEFYFTEVLM